MKNSPLLRCKLLVKKSSIHGYGVFADQMIQPGEMIEECYALCFQRKNEMLIDYTFGINDGCVLPLGYGAIYNHSHQPNAQCILDLENAIITFEATRFIEKGEEIFIYYSKEWFSSRQIKHKEVSLRFNISQILSPLMILLRFSIVMGAMVAFMMMVKSFSYI